MKYNFDEVIDRKGTHAMKVERLPKGADKDSLALWVADMDFACAEPILKALHERIDRKIFGYTMYDADECMDAVTGWMKKRYGWEESRENLFFCPGRCGCLCSAHQPPHGTGGRDRPPAPNLLSIYE